MIGPECVAQHRKFVASKIMNCGERTACESDISGTGAPSPAAAACPLSIAGGRRTNSDTGIMIAATTTAITCIEVRQSWCEISQAASGAMINGAIPMPAETSETARLRWVSNQPVTHAIIGAKMAEIEPPTSSPNRI